jgi:Flp pilus assembly protein TadD
MLPVIIFLALLQAQDESPRQLLQSAIAEQQSGDYRAAIRDYKELLKFHPADVEARVNLGAALAQVGDFDGAIQQYKQALSLMPAAYQMPVRLNLALAYYKKGDLQSALPEFEALHHAQVQDRRIAVLLGDTQIKLGRPADALEMLAPLEAANQRDPDFEYVLGLAMIRAGKLREGAQRMENAGGISHSGDAYLFAGSALMQLNEFEQARHDLEVALQLNPKLPGLYTLVGMARDQTGDAKAAELAFREALKENPNDFQANLYLGTILYKRRDLEEARPFLEEALRLSPSSPLARYENAMWKKAVGDDRGAADDLAALVKDDPQWLEPHVELAALYYKLHRPADGDRERHIVDQLTAEQQTQGPPKY